MKRERGKKDKQKKKKLGKKTVNIQLRRKIHLTTLTKF